MEVVDVRRPTPFALDAPIAVEVRGYNLDDLSETADEVARRMVEIPGLTDIRTTVRPGYPEARVTFDRDKMLAYGLDLGEISNYVRNQVLGDVSTRFVEGDDRIDVRVRGDETILDSIADVAELVVNPAADTPVPLRSVAVIDLVQGPAEIRRIGGQRAVLVTARARAWTSATSTRASRPPSPTCARPRRSTSLSAVRRASSRRAPRASASRCSSRSSWSMS